MFPTVATRNMRRIILYGEFTTRWKTIFFHQILENDKSGTGVLYSWRTADFITFQMLRDTFHVTFYTYYIVRIFGKQTRMRRFDINKLFCSLISQHY